MGGASKKIQPRKYGVSETRMEEKLTVNQRMFVENLLATNPWSPGEAAKKAGYKHSSQAATKLLNNNEVCRAIGRAIQDRIWRCQVDANRVLDELSTIAFANIKELFDQNGLLIPIHQLPDSIARAVDHIEVKTVQVEGDDGNKNTVTVAKIKLHSKLTALEMLMKHLGMMEARLEVDHTTDTREVLSNILANINSQSDGVIGDQEIEAMVNQRLLPSTE